MTNANNGATASRCQLRVWYCQILSAKYPPSTQQLPSIEGPTTNDLVQMKSVALFIF